MTVADYEAEINCEFISMEAIKKGTTLAFLISTIGIGGQCYHSQGLPRGTTEALSCAEATDRRHRGSVNSDREILSVADRRSVE
jgi:hypothetical protein